MTQSRESDDESKVLNFPMRHSTEHGRFGFVATEPLAACLRQFSKTEADLGYLTARLYSEAQPMIRLSSGELSPPDVKLQQDVEDAIAPFEDLKLPLANGYSPLANADIYGIAFDAQIDPEITRALQGCNRLADKFTKEVMRVAFWLPEEEFVDGFELIEAEERLQEVLSIKKVGAVEAEQSSGASITKMQFFVTAYH